MIAIKGMEMPSRCMNCGLLGKEEMYCSVYPRKDLDIITVATNRPDWCPLVEIVTCKDCKHWKDSDGVYRRGIGAESKCPINIKKVFDGNFFCADGEFKVSGSPNIKLEEDVPYNERRE